MNPDAPAFPRLRWLALLTDDLERTTTAAERELDVRRCFTDPEIGEFGMANAVLALGDCFLEICTPIQEDAWPHRLLQRQGPGGLLALFQVDDLDVYRRRAAALDVRIAAHFPRRRFPAGEWESIQLHPKDVGGHLVSFDVCDPPNEFPPVDADWRGAPGATTYTGFTGLQLATPKVARTATTWGELLGRTPADHQILLRDATLAFTETANAGRFTGFELGCTDAAAAREFDLDSMRVRVAPPG